VIIFRTDGIPERIPDNDPMKETMTLRVGAKCQRRGHHPGHPAWTCGDPGRRGERRAFLTFDHARMLTATEARVACGTIFKELTPLSPAWALSHTGKGAFHEQVRPRPSGLL
jgi:hypothetical protein